ncbi:MAG: adenylosuccinate lyase [Deltaproteobacteria bacterium]|jgi:adenylosuccinate lyase|nr:adenylosuccinate lyase [Deltaproteobacteria bacterium]
MIGRYSRERMASIWTLENQYASWLKVELAVVRCQSELGLIPKAEAQEILSKASFDASRIKLIEDEVHHDVVAFVTNVEENVGEAGRFFHFGLTSSDVLDTSLSLRLLEAHGIILEGLDGLLDALRQKAEENASLLGMGRSHGIHAEPTPFGLRFASFHAEFKRNRKRLENLRDNLATGKISGPVGNFSSKSVTPELEEKVLGSLGLKPTPVSTQVLPRDIHAEFFLALSLMATSLERMAVEIRHLSRTEVGEAEEAFGDHQKGSSAMPHKKNPISAENISGLARLVRAYGEASLDDVVLWHERDISHSSVERVIAPDATILTDYLLARATSLIRGLVVKRDKVEKNLELTGGLYNSQGLLLALVEKGLSRTQAYHLVQSPALLAKDLGVDFKTLVLESQEIRKYLNPVEIEDLFSDGRFSKWGPAIMSRALDK